MAILFNDAVVNSREISDFLPRLSFSDMSFCKAKNVFDKTSSFKKFILYIKIRLAVQDLKYHCLNEGTGCLKSLVFWRIPK